MPGPTVFPILVFLVALEHCAIATLEMFFWDKPMGLKVFRFKPDFATQTKVLAANQGLYNLFLGFGLLLSFFVDAASAHALRLYLLSCVFVAGSFGAYTLHFRVFLFQGLPAAFALFFLIMGI